jgi:hypothetical protein
MSCSRSLAEFQAEFPDEVACAEFLIRHRWPAGFVCPTGGGCRAARLRRNTRPRRIRLAVIPDLSQEPIHAFVRANIAPGSTLLTDGHASDLGLNEGPQGERYVLDPRVVGKTAHAKREPVPETPESG